MTEQFAMTLFDYRGTLQWVRELGWTDDELAQVAVHEQATAGEDYINLANMGGTPLGVTARGGGGTSADVSSIHNMYVYKSEVPEHLWNRLVAIINRGGTSGYESSGVFGEFGEAREFPPKS